MIASDVPLKNLRKLSERVRPPLFAGNLDERTSDQHSSHISDVAAGLNRSRSMLVANTYTVPTWSPNVVNQIIEDRANPLI